MNLKFIQTRRMLVFILFLFLTPVTYGQTFDFPALVKRIQSDNWSTTAADVNSLNTQISKQAADGSWPDYQYGAVPVSGSNRHLNRVVNIARAVTSPTHPKYNDEAYKKAVQKAVYFWMNSNTTDTNWWWASIGWPKDLGVIAILMRQFQDYLSQGEFGVTEKQLLNTFQPTAVPDLTSRGLGANMFDIGYHYIYRGILTGDAKLLTETSTLLQKNLLSNIQSDLTFQDHGPQMHISSYGGEYEKAVVGIAYYLSGTPAAFDVKAESFGTFLRFVREVQIPAIRGQYWDYSVTGRGISRVNATKGSLDQLDLLRNFIDPANAEVYDAAIVRMAGTKPASFGVPVFNKHYWKSDYTQHSQTNYLFTVRNVSKRTVETEKGNNENLKANYLAYGANFIGVTGNEYYNIMPVWDWSMIPGVTARQTTEFAPRKDWGENFGRTTFVGGVSANGYGAVALDMDYDGTLAKKGWFMFKDEIVCVGAGIKSTNANVRTTLNQCNGTGNAFYSTGNGEESKVANGDATESPAKAAYIRHDKTAYFFPESQNVKFTLSNQSGTWRAINASQATTPVTKEVFKLWIEHGDKPEDKTYSYIIVPNIADEAAAKKYDAKQIEILKNDKEMQAVYHSGLKVLQAVFYKPGTVKRGNFSLTVDIPCVVQVLNDTLISIADPEQSSVRGNLKLSANGKSYTSKVELPGGEFAGSTVAAVLSKVEDVTNPTNPTNPGAVITANEPLPAATDRVNIFPNPGDSSFTIDLNQPFQKVTVEIFNADGKSLFQHTYANKTTLEISFDMPASGMYFVHVTTADGTVVKKLMRTR